LIWLFVITAFEMDLIEHFGNNNNIFSGCDYDVSLLII